MNPSRTGQEILETPLGFIGLAWTGQGLRRLCLPDTSRAVVERRLSRHDTDTMPVGTAHVGPEWLEELMRGICSYANGENTDFADVPLDLAGIDAFRVAVYAAARKLRFGETVTYGELAARAGHPGLARETGAALGSNPVPLVVPCHRILAAGGKIGGFSAPGGAASKARMLALEGVSIGPPPPAQQAFGF
ncbi:methylated-DNA--[protein]-cysteine S-methyltransferase [Mesorhizobium sp. 10J20-29]